MNGNGNGHAEVPRFYQTSSIDGVAEAFGFRLEARVSVRFPARCREELEAWIVREKKTGRISIGYSEGGYSYVHWEETR